MPPTDETAAARLGFLREPAWATPTGWAMLPPSEAREEDDRATRLVLQAWSDKAVRGLRPDVLAITADALAAPKEPQTAEITRFAIILAMRSGYGIEYDPETVRELRVAYDDLRRMLEGVGRSMRPKMAASPASFFLGDILCMDGWLGRTFAPSRAVRYYDAFLEAPLGIRGARPVFTDASGGTRLEGGYPEFGEVLTLAFSQPTAIPGLDAIMGGMMGPVVHPLSGKRTDEESEDPSVESAPAGGLVSLLTGPPGSGKTSFSLLLAARLAEMGSVVRYVSTEENPSVLRSKSYTMTESLAEAFEATLGQDLDEPDIDWLDGRQFENLEAVVTTLQEEFSEARADEFDSMEFIAPQARTEIHLPFPRVVVIDSLSAMLHQNRHRRAPQLGRRTADETGLTREELADLLTALRDLGVCVLLVGSEGEAGEEDLAYLVDNAFALSLEADVTPRHPVRLLAVDKTRLQWSSRGRHVFHLGGRHGGSISPSLHAVLRSLKGRSELPPDTDAHAVLFADAGAAVLQKDIFRPSPQTPITIADRAHTLVYGVGSSGKSRFALALALEPRVDVRNSEELKRYLSHRSRSLETTLSAEEASSLDRARLLVISFLYQPVYYHRITSDLLYRRFRQSRDVADSKAEKMTDVVAIQPGFVDPEWVVGTVRQRLRSAELDGRPYTGIVVDGLHNVLMQFPLLQRDPLLWPTLYRLVRTRGISTVSTFTFFGVGSVTSGASAIDKNAELGLAELFATRPAGHGGLAVSHPLFFHLLVSSCDYTFNMSRPAEMRNVAQSIYSRVELESSPGIVPRRQVWWDPEALKLILQPPT